MAKLLSDQTASELPAIFEAVRNIPQATRGRPIRRDRGGVGGDETKFGLCTITEEKTESLFAVDVVLGNPNDSENTEVISGLLYLNYATTNAIAIGAQIMAITYSSTATPEEGEDPVSLDCYPIETLYNLIAPPTVEEGE